MGRLGLSGFRFWLGARLGPGTRLGLGSLLVLAAVLVRPMVVRLSTKLHLPVSILAVNRDHELSLRSRTGAADPPGLSVVYERQLYLTFLTASRRRSGFLCPSRSDMRRFAESDLDGIISGDTALLSCTLAA